MTHGGWFSEYLKQDMDCWLHESCTGVEHSISLRRYCPGQTSGQGTLCCPVKMNLKPELAPRCHQQQQKGRWVGLQGIQNVCSLVDSSQLQTRHSSKEREYNWRQRGWMAPNPGACLVVDSYLARARALAATPCARCSAPWLVSLRTSWLDSNRPSWHPPPAPRPPSTNVSTPAERNTGSLLGTKVLLLWCLNRTTKNIYFFPAVY